MKNKLESWFFLTVFMSLFPFLLKLIITSFYHEINKAFFANSEELLLFNIVLCLTIHREIKMYIILETSWFFSTMELIFIIILIFSCTFYGIWQIEFLKDLDDIQIRYRIIRTMSIVGILQFLVGSGIIMLLPNKGIINRTKEKA